MIRGAIGKESASLSENHVAPPCPCKYGVTSIDGEGDGGPDPEHSGAVYQRYKLKRLPLSYGGHKSCEFFGIGGFEDAEFDSIIPDRDLT